MGAQAQWDVLVSLGAARRTTAAAGPETFSGAVVDLRAYVNPGGREVEGILNVGAITSTGTLNVKFQGADSTAEGSFADISGASFTATGNSGSLTGSEVIHFRTNQRYLRAIAAIANTGNFDFMVGVKAQARLV